VIVGSKRRSKLTLPALPVNISAESRIDDCRSGGGLIRGPEVLLHATLPSRQAHLQTRTGNELLERLQYFRLSPRVIVDLGCGTGNTAQRLRRRYPRAQLLAIDPEFAMTRQARARQRFWRRFDCICAKALALPLKDQSVDLVFSNLMTNWGDDPGALSAEMRRVLRPGGLLLYSTFGPETLKELRSAWASVDPEVQPGGFADMTQLASAMSHAGLAEPVMDRDAQVERYADVWALMDELSLSDTGHGLAGPHRSSSGSTQFEAMVSNYESLRTGAGIPATWEIIYGAAFAGTDTRRIGNQAVAGEYAVPLSALRPRNPSGAD
jgi:malonyl-CoA O-methyltransferase